MAGLSNTTTPSSSCKGTVTATPQRILENAGAGMSRVGYVVFGRGRVIGRLLSQEYPGRRSSHHVGEGVRGKLATTIRENLSARRQTDSGREGTGPWRGSVGNFGIAEIGVLQFVMVRREKRLGSLINNAITNMGEATFSRVNQSILIEISTRLRIF